jgi:hypothetical protein
MVQSGSNSTKSEWMLFRRMWRHGFIPDSSHGVSRKTGIVLMRTSTVKNRSTPITATLTTSPRSHPCIAGSTDVVSCMLPSFPKKSAIAYRSGQETNSSLIEIALNLGSVLGTSPAHGQKRAPYSGCPGGRGSRIFSEVYNPVKRGLGYLSGKIRLPPGRFSPELGTHASVWRHVRIGTVNRGTSVRALMRWRSCRRVFLHARASVSNMGASV